MPVSPKSVFDKVIALNATKLLIVVAFAAWIIWLIPEKERFNLLNAVVPVICVAVVKNHSKPDA